MARCIFASHLFNIYFYPIQMNYQGVGSMFYVLRSRFMDLLDFYDDKM